MLGLHKWALAFNKGHQSTVITEHLIETTEPSLDLVEDLTQISAIFDLTFDMESLVAFVVNKGYALANDEGLFVTEDNTQIQSLLRWGLIFFKIGNGENMHLKGM